MIAPGGFRRALRAVCRTGTGSECGTDDLPARSETTSHALERSFGMNKLLASTAVCLVLGTAAFAQSNNSTTNSPNSSQPQNSARDREHDSGSQRAPDSAAQNRPSGSERSSQSQSPNSAQNQPSGSAKDQPSG